MKKLIESTVDLKYFDQYVFYNISSDSNFIGHTNLQYLCKNLNFNNEQDFNFSEDKVNIWYVRNDKCSDYVYNNQLDVIRENIPNEIVDYINSNKLILLLSTATEFDTDSFWNKVVEPWVIDFIDNIFVTGIQRFIDGLRSDNK